MILFNLRYLRRMQSPNTPIKTTKPTEYTINEWQIKTNHYLHRICDAMELKEGMPPFALKLADSNRVDAVKLAGYTTGGYNRAMRCPGAPMKKRTFENALKADANLLDKYRIVYATSTMMWRNLSNAFNGLMDYINQEWANGNLDVNAIGTFCALSEVFENIVSQVFVGEKFTGFPNLLDNTQWFCDTTAEFIDMLNINPESTALVKSICNTLKSNVQYLCQPIDLFFTRE